MKRRVFIGGAASVLALVAYLVAAPGERVGRYTKPATAKVLEAWKSHFEAKRHLVPPPPVLPSGAPDGVDFTGEYRFGKYDYDLTITQKGRRVVMRSGGVDHQDIGGAFDTLGEGYVQDGKVYVRWWCFDLTRNFANTGGAEIWFADKAKNRIEVRYYHDADEKIEEGYGVRVGTAPGEKLHYRIRVKQPVRTYDEARVVRGTVRGRDGEAIHDALVLRRHEEGTSVRTDGAGRFEMRFTRVPTVLMISAGARGYRNKVESILFQEFRELHFVLDPVGTEDDPRYVFVSPTPDRSSRDRWEPTMGKKGFDLWRCGNCHRNSYDEWKFSRHAWSAKNAVTKAVFEKDFLPALSAGKATGDVGLCTACHAPQAALDYQNVPLNEVTGIALKGNHCDFCHKIHHTDDLDAPGVRGSTAVRRPSPDDDSVPGLIKRVYGTLADADYLMMGPTYHPFFGTSALCAGCHQYTTPTGLPALHTYREWGRWAAGRSEHESCQSCHMAEGTSYERKRVANRICINALRRPGSQIHHHGFVGREMASKALEVKVTARRGKSGIEVNTVVITKDVGHKVPTGSSDKHLLLVVTVTDASGVHVGALEGPRVPEHAGGSADIDLAKIDMRVAAGDLAGLPGREFALVFADEDGHTHVPFWRAKTFVRDTRLEPDSTTSVQHRFATATGKLTIRAELFHRLRIKRDDVAADLEPGKNGVRPLDLLVGAATVELD
ncbi:MAG: multiheme c-type cytochrome [Planctomycetota bacterium]